MVNLSAGKIVINRCVIYSAVGKYAVRVAEQLNTVLDHQSSCFTGAAPDMTQHAIIFKPNLYIISGYNQLPENSCKQVPQKIDGKNDKNNRIH